MQTIVNKIFSKQEEKQPLIYSMTPSALSNVPFHTDTNAIIRYIATAFPLHMAVHHVSPVFIPPAAYTQPHVHDDSDEINIIISTQRLIYQIQLGEQEYIVHSNTAIWIPRGTLHSANVLKGSGFFIALRLDQ